MIRSVFFLLAVALLTSGRAVIADVIEIDNNALEQLLEQGTVIVDVRRQDEWERTGLIAGSVPMTFFDARGNHDAEAWVRKLSALVKPDQEVVLICAHGTRSASIATLLDERLGFTRVHNVTKGIVGWLAEDRPVTNYTP